MVGPQEREAGVLLGPEELVAPGGLILLAAAGLLGPRTGTPVGLAAVTYSAAATAVAVAAAGQRMLTVGPEGPVAYRARAEAVELRVGLVPARVV